jgi:prepilin-type N-terminal cleavage/methylation domain-containing protein
MQTRVTNSSREARRRGFSLIELLTAVSIMVIIIFALYSMFAQVQKALRANITQVDVLESGRAASEMLGRELESLSACNLPATINLQAGLLYVGNTPLISPLMQMDADEKTALRTNLIQEIFFLSRQNNRWVGTGYRVMRADDGVGTLYRFSTQTNYYMLNHTNLIFQFLNSSFTNAAGQVSTNFNRVADGIIHMRLTAYDPDGRQLTARGTNMYHSYRLLRLDSSGARQGLTSTAGSPQEANVILRQQFGFETQTTFLSNALPAYVDLELGVLEPAALRQYESLRDAPRTATAFLRKQGAKVHLFRQRIPIRTVEQ